jgi:hypothetical protein
VKAKGVRDLGSPNKMNRRKFIKYIAGAGVVAVAGGGAASLLWPKPQPPHVPMIVYCGIDCAANKCGQFGVSCDGCTSTTGRIAAYTQTCQVRQCCIGRGLQNCAYCNDYVGCAKLTSIFNYDPGAKTRLDDIRAHR